MNPISTARRRRGFPGSEEREAGAAMLVAVMVITVVAVLCASMAVLAMRSTRAAGDSRTAGVVKDLANAGLSQGVTYLRQTGATPAVSDPSNAFPSSAACVNPGAASSTPTWTRSKPAQVGAGTQGTYLVWLEKDSAQADTYRVCAVGSAGQGKRAASVQAQYKPAGGGASPYVVYSKGRTNLQSAAQAVTNLSVYSETCIDRKHNKATVGGLDPTGVPAAAHSLAYVVPKGGCGESASVHAGSDYVDSMFPYDTDLAGGPVGGDPQLSGHSELLSAPWSGSTLETSQNPAEFRARWGLPDMLGDASIEAYFQRANEQGNYYKDKAPNLVAAPDDTHAVVFLDYTATTSVNLKSLDLGDWSSGTCQAGKSLIIVTRNANVSANGNGTLRANVIVKNGNVTKMNGNFTVIGGLFVDGTTDLSGTSTITLDACAKQNPPAGGTPQVVLSRYMEYDRA